MGAREISLAPVFVGEGACWRRCGQLVCVGGECREVPIAKDVVHDVRESLMLPQGVGTTRDEERDVNFGVSWLPKNKRRVEPQGLACR